MSTTEKNAAEFIHSKKPMALIKNSSIKDMEYLAKELRNTLVSIVSKGGGHLASNLGVVELTLALHHVFDSQEDRIVWDVGHQTYVHKILTGRLDQMDSLRKKNGISGFPKREESPHDAFNTGHSSTAISAALGMARARDLKGEHNHIIAVVGDGALTGGMALEAMNDAGIGKTNLLVILNDNGMSISENVGGLSRYLSLLRTKPAYNKAHQKAGKLADKLPAGRLVHRLLHWLKTVLKSTLLPSMLFEDFGFRYFGPVDGHNLEDLIAFLEHMKTLPGPLLLHVRTQKGRGYPFAEKSPNVFHGMSPFEIETGSPIKCSEGTWSELFGNAMLETAKTMPELVAVTAAMPEGTGLSIMQQQFPERVFDVGIAEQHAVTFAAGLAVNGLKPVVAIYSTFLQRAYDQILHDVCLQNLPVVFAVDRAGIVGDDGETHQGIYDLSFLGSMPNMTILAPASAIEIAPMLQYALIACGGPVAIRYPRGCAEVLPVPTVPLTSQSAVMMKEGKDAAILAVGPMVQQALEAAEILAKEGMDIAVVHARFIKPFDAAMLKRLSGLVPYILTVEENVRIGGFGAEVVQYLVKDQYAGKVDQLAFPDEPVPQGNRYDTLKEYGLHADAIAQRVRQNVKTGSRNAEN